MSKRNIISFSDRRNDLENKTIRELKNIAKERNIRGYSSLRKAELIKLLDKYKSRGSKPHKNITEEGSCNVNWVYPRKLESSNVKICREMFHKNLDLNFDKDEICKIINTFNPSVQWMKEQKEYSKKLPAVEKSIIFDYSVDQYILNSYLRGDEDYLDYIGYTDIGNDIPEYRKFSMAIILGFDGTKRQLTEKGKNKLASKYHNKMDSFIKDMSQDYNVKYFAKSVTSRGMEICAKMMNDIIRNAPKLDKNIIVYRGISTIDYFDLEKENIVRGLLSTTNDFKVALRFSDSDPSYILKITVPIGTPCLAMYSGNPSTFSESEIIFPDGITLILGKMPEESQDLKIPYASPRMLSKDRFERDIKYDPSDIRKDIIEEIYVENKQYIVYETNIIIKVKLIECYIAKE